MTVIEVELPPFHGPDLEGANSPLRLRLRDDLLTELLSHAKQDFRLYELWSIRRPGDLGDYVSVELLSETNTLLAHASFGLEEDSEVVRDLSLGRAVSLRVFEELLGGEGEDESTGVTQWMRWRRSPEFRDYLNRLHAEARQFLDKRTIESVIAEHVVRRIELRQHGLCYLPLAKAIEVSRRQGPSTPGKVSDEFLQKLQESLRESDIRSAVVAGYSIESSVVRSVCAEQRDRAALSGLSPLEAFKVCALADESDVPFEWEAHVRIQWEGIPRGDLWICLWRMVESSKYQWVTERACRLVLCATNHGEVVGFTRTQGPGWTLYRRHDDLPQALDSAETHDEKDSRYRSLVRERKSCTNCAGLTNPSSPCLGRFDGPEIGPWTRWQRDLNARVMIVGQDWGGSIAYLRQHGVDVDSPTNRNLRELLGGRGYVIQSPDSPERDNGVFLTNAVLCIKEGADSGALRAAWLRACGRIFLRKQIELIAPRVVVSLGYDAYRAVMCAFDQQPLQTMAEAVATTPILEIGSGRKGLFVPNFHCGGLGMRGRPMPQQRKDWLRVPCKQ